MTKDFTLYEFLLSNTANALGIRENLTPPQSVIDNLTALATNILQPLRDEVGRIKINSGYRCPRLNAAVKGAKNSQHLTGEAADIEGIDISNAELFEAIKRIKLPFDQLIWEFGTRSNPSWVHVSFSPRNRRQILYIPKNLQK